jgi:hypothetical protein
MQTMTCQHGSRGIATCGRCHSQWCADCDPCPAALCHTCHGRGYSTAPRGEPRALPVSKLRARIEANRHETHFFSRENMRFSGDTMRNYGARGPLKFRTNAGEECYVFELYRRKATRKGLTGSAYFRADTYAQTWGEVIE